MIFICELKTDPLIHTQFVSDSLSQAVTRSPVCVLSSLNPLSSCFQNLPKPPVPSLEDTIVRYLAGLEPVIPSQQFEQTRQTAQIFLHNGEGKGLQKLLTEYAEESDNWVSQLTKQQNARCPILIPSAGAGLPAFVRLKRQWWH